MSTVYGEGGRGRAQGQRAHTVTMTVCAVSQSQHTEDRDNQPHHSRVPVMTALHGSYRAASASVQIPSLHRSHVSVSLEPWLGTWLGKIIYAYTRRDLETKYIARPLRPFHASVASVSCVCFMFYETTHETDSDEELSISSPRRLCAHTPVRPHAISAVPTSLPRHAARVVDHPSRRTADDQRAAEPVADAACSCGSQTVHRSAGTLCSGNTKWLCSVQTDCNHRHDLCCG